MALIKNTSFSEIGDAAVIQAFEDTDREIERLEERLTTLEKLAVEKTASTEGGADGRITTEDLLIQGSGFANLNAQIASSLSDIAWYQNEIPFIQNATASNLATQVTYQATWNKFNTRDPSGTLQWYGNSIWVRRLTPPEMEIRCVYSQVSGGASSSVSMTVWDGAGGWPGTWDSNSQSYDSPTAIYFDTGYHRILRGRSQFGEGQSMGILTNQSGSGEMQYVIYGKNSYTGRTATIGTINRTT